ncbi:tRNA (uridine(54)-C5)-methyltransferase TrmA [Agaribacter flavus]|uniref:tRNA/tmRNA (uracil-C(5))-methyltransferase n=1 Tax=Agaribacter flavus TaxID=1902781 RepID=A0ABV7FQZ0_9ALTE
MASMNENYETQLNKKHEYLCELLSPYYQNDVAVFKSSPSGYRMRAEFRVWHEGVDLFHIMFDKGTKEKYRVDNLPAAYPLINSAMEVIIPLLKDNQTLRKKLFQIDYLATTSNEILISLIYHKALNEEWEEEAKVLKNLLSAKLNTSLNLIGRAKKQKIVLNQDYVTERLTVFNKAYSFVQVENSFTQPNALINQHMIEWSIEQLRDVEGDLLELYCGAGNFSVPLSGYCSKVLATEISKTSVNAAQVNIRDNHVENLTIARLSSEEFVEAFKGLRTFRRLEGINLNDYQFSSVLVDPPRAGLDEQTIKLIAQFNYVLYISCNPLTLAQNLKDLNKTHKVEKLALFDQFPFTPHIETGVLLAKR